MSNEIKSEHRMEYYTCKRIRLLSYLRAKGFIPYETIPDLQNPKYYNWKFHNTPELQEAIEEYFSRYKKN